MRPLKPDVKSPWPQYPAELVRRTEDKGPRTRPWPPARRSRHDLPELVNETVPEGTGANRVVGLYRGTCAEGLMGARPSDGGGCHRQGAVRGVTRLDLLRRHAEETDNPSVGPAWFVEGVRPVADSYPVLGMGAEAIVVNGGGEVLLIRRPPLSSSDPGCWDLPGRKMDGRELLADTLIREVSEETELTVSAAKARPFHVSNFVKEPFWVTCVTFACPSFEGEVRLSVEHVEHRWVAPGEHHGLRYARAIKEQLDAYVSLR